MSVKAITRNGRPFWRVEVYRDGERRRAFLDRPTHKKRDALAREREIIAELEGPQRGRRTRRAKPSTQTTDAAGLPAPSPARRRARGRRQRKKSSPTLREFAARFMALEDRERSDYTNKASHLREHILPVLGDRALAEISRVEIDAFISSLRTVTRRSNRRRSPKTINNILTTLRRILRKAHEYGLIEHMPVVPTEKVPKRDPRFLDFEEAEAFVAAAEPCWQPVFRLAIATGLRQGELMELRFGDVDLERAVIRVARAVRKREGRWEVRDTTKGGRARTVPLDPEMVAMLSAMAEGADPGALVFPGGEERGFLSTCEHFGSNQMYRAAKRAGKTALARHVNPHQTRHSFASQLAMDDAPLRRIQQWLGHVSVGTTLRYAHLKPDQGEEYIHRVAERRQRARARGKTTATTTATSTATNRHQGDRTASGGG